MRKGELVFNRQEAFPTMELDPGTLPGDAVTLTGPARVGRGTDGAPLVGKVLKVESDGLGTVALRGAGFTDIPTAGTLTVGYQVLAVDGAGKAKAGTPGSAPHTLINIATAGSANVCL